ncbi:MAG: PilZ domain-containing protein [Geopsychrobacter sp.]|nr:PilZ domain-containing protein [Geopsychrobacter sp.]
MAGSNNNFKVRLDMPKNRLYCTVGGNVTKIDVERFFTDVRFSVADLKPGFDVVTDFTNCHFGHLAAIPTFRKIMHYFASKGVRDVVRVVNTNNLIYKQALNFAARVQGYSPVYVETLKEAEELLDRSGRRTELRFNLFKKDIFYGTDSLSLQGELVNISISGCAIKTVADPPPVGQKMQVNLSLTGQQSVFQKFELSAVVARLLDGGFAVAFTKFEDADREKLWTCLVQESRLDV